MGITTNHWHYNNEISPMYLNYVSVLNGHYPVQISEDFNYCEIGCRRGLTVNGLAELFPNGQFIGIDNNPGYIEFAKQMAAETNCSNVDFWLLEFDAINRRKYPAFDFIILSDIYSWVDKSIRKGLLKFINLNLKSGGILYVNYESMPGCLALLPLREAVEVHAGSIEADDLVKTQSSLDYLDFIAQKKAPFFIDNPMAGKFVDDMKRVTNNDLNIKLMHKSFEPFFFGQVSSSMKEIGLIYSGSADIHLNFIDLAVSTDYQELLKNVSTRDEFESRGDFIRNQAYRRDIFIREKESMNEDEALQALSEFVFGMTCAEDELQSQYVFGDVVLDYDNDVFHDVNSILSEFPHTAQSLSKIFENKGYSLELILDALKFLTSGRQITPVLNSEYNSQDLNLNANRYEFTLKSNIQYLKHFLFKQESITLLCAKAGVGLELSMSDALFALCIVEASPDQASDWAVQRLLEANQEILVNDLSETETIASGFKKFVERRLSKLLELGILSPA